MNELHTTTHLDTKTSPEFSGETRRNFSRNKKGMGGWLNNCSFAFCLAALVILLLSVRIPPADELGSVRFTKNISLVGDHRAGGGELKFLARGTCGEYPAAERTGASRGAVDLDRLARAVAVAETSGCARGVGITHNNCHGLRDNGDWIRFDSPAASAECFKKNWIKHYGGFPTLEDAKKYTGNDRAESWLKNVEANY